MLSLKILQVLPELNLGGVERVTLDMVSALRQAFPETFVASNGGSLLTELERLGGTHFTLPLASKNPFQIVRNAQRLADLIRTHNIDLIHARSRAPAWTALLAARFTDIPLVTTYHGAYSSTNMLKSLYNSVMTRGDRVIAISQFIANHINKNYPNSHSKVRLIHEGIDVEEFNPQHVSQKEIEDIRHSWGISPNTTVFLVPGRVTRLKGQLIFIDAIRQLNVPNVAGVILGQTQESQSYTMEVRRSCNGLPIHLLPQMSRPRAAYAAADVIVSPTLAQEAFGRVTAEAGAMERVIITTNLGAAPEICQHNKTGFLIPPEDSRALADAMMQSLKMSPHDYLSMGKAARTRICSNFSLTRMCSETIELYRELVK